MMIEKIEGMVPPRVRMGVRSTLDWINLNRYGRRKAAYVYKGRWGLHYLVYPESYIDFQVLRRGAYSDWLVLYGHRIIRPDGIAIDIGANAGLVTLPLAAHTVPQGRVIAVEPDEECYVHLTTNVRINRLANVTVKRMALQDDPAATSITLYQRRGGLATGLVNDGISTIQSSDLADTVEFQVPAATLDKLCQDEALTRIDVVKIDVEGAEARVLRGGKKAITSTWPIIQYEYAPVHDALAEGDNSRETFALLNEWGYRQYKTGAAGNLTYWKTPDPAVPYGNILCVPETKYGALSGALVQFS